FFGHPKVVRIQKRHIPAPCDTDTIVACGRHTASLPGDAPHNGTVLCQVRGGTLIGTVIDDKKLPRLIALCQYRFNSLPDHGPTIIGGNNDAYDGGHSSTR